jgi:antitoxin (DNA-binding transcriptional repressor) of toxin-antitoxin stability system
MEEPPPATPAVCATRSRFEAVMNRTTTTATVSDLRYRFPDIEARLRRGEVIEIRRWGKAIARLHPIRPQPETYPDFAALRKEIFGNKMARQTGTELISEFRGDY